jgi:hypothetical protein
MPSAFEHGPSLTVPASNTTAKAAVIWSAASNLGESTIILDSGGNGRIGIAGDLDTITITSGTVTVAGAITASGIVSGVGSGLTALNGTQITSGTLPAARIAADSIVEGKLNVSNGPTNGHVLTARDGVAGGFTWEAAASGGVDTTGTPADNQIPIFTDADTLEGRAELTHDGTNLLTKNTTGNNSYIIISHSSATGGHQSGIYFKQNTTTNVKLDVTTDGHMTWRQGAGETVAMVLKASQGGLGIGSGIDVDQVRGTLHVKTGDSGYDSVYSGSDDLIVENSTTCGITISTPDNANSFWCHATPTGGTQTSGFYTGYNSGNEYFAIMNAGGEKFKVLNNDVSGAHGTYHTSSDERIKENIVDITYGLASVMAMRPVEYDFCEWYNPSLSDKTRLGFIAQEVKAVVPEVVNIATDPRSFKYKADDDTDVVETHETIEDMHSIEELQIIPILVKAIQELNDKIDALGI